MFTPTPRYPDTPPVGVAAPPCYVSLRFIPRDKMATDFLTATLSGGPTVLLEVDGLRLLTDPTFDPPEFLRESYSKL
jgi:hypothetical protein